MQITTHLCTYSLLKLTLFLIADSKSSAQFLRHPYQTLVHVCTIKENLESSAVCVIRQVVFTDMLDTASIEIRTRSRFAMIDRLKTGFGLLPNKTTNKQFTCTFLPHATHQNIHNKVLIIMCTFRSALSSLFGTCK